MNPEIKVVKEKKFIGQKIETSFLENKTFQLWKNFMPRRKEIKNNIGIELYSMEVYPPLFFENFDYSNNFEKWAAIEVSDFNFIPDGMEKLISPTGLYAIFLYKGLSGEAKNFYNHIFQVWLPSSGFLLDNRPHFAVIGDKYKNNDPDSEEDIYIPILQSSS